MPNQVGLILCEYVSISVTLNPKWLLSVLILQCIYEQKHSPCVSLLIICCMLPLSHSLSDMTNLNWLLYLLLSSLLFIVLLNAASFYSLSYMTISVLCQDLPATCLIPLYLIPYSESLTPGSPRINSFLSLICNMLPLLSFKQCTFSFIHV